ncbi:hypothetical protein CTAYLR_010388 [Chrysophaeum taylorii]|uniref:Uncharacterized protein n=1 Tax=Chrysophaeum taylorii TaxID=2483200 RepID=A0AAD7XGY0_9STRA|nr:hypothetical protein CTAYLR_010388 [Chrysophaeum taylorii]
MGTNTATCGFAELVVFFGALISGTGCSLFSKVLLSMHSIGREGTDESFQNPLFQTWAMFLGMACSLPLHMANEARERRRAKCGYAAIGEPERKPVPLTTYFLLAIPSLFDLAATAFAMFGLTYITVSVYQILRGGAIVFVAILKHFVLCDKLLNFMWVGVGLNVLSIVMVGLTASDEGSGPSNDKNPLVGVGLILCGAIVQSLQYAFEEKVMSSDVGTPPLLVITMEGIWGFIVCTCVLYPVCSYLNLEDPMDTWIMLKNSGEIQFVFALYFIAVFFYNLFGVLVTYMLNSVWHAILDNFRPITVWATDLAIYYVFTRGTYGETWGFPGSYIQLAALAVLIYGTAVYNGSVRLPGFSYPEPAPEPYVSRLASPLIVRASPALASPALSRSPLIMGVTRPGLPQHRRAPVPIQPPPIAELAPGTRPRANSQ